MNAFLRTTPAVPSPVKGLLDLTHLTTGNAQIKLLGEAQLKAEGPGASPG